MSKSQNNVSKTKFGIIEMIASFEKDNSEKASKSLKHWISSGEYLKDLSNYTELGNIGKKIDAVVCKLRDILPRDAILPTEKIECPTIGANADCQKVHTLHFDEFLYDSEDDFEEFGKDFNRRFCEDCGSSNIKDKIIISHSMSRNKLLYVFDVLLPKDCSDKKILDVGSRIGAVLYGAYFYTTSPKIFGVEFNEELCCVQQKVIEYFNMEDRITLIQGDVSMQSDIVGTSDIIILNNVFEFFMSSKDQVKVWEFLIKTIKSGCLLVTIPSIEESLNNLEIYSDNRDWVQSQQPFQEANQICFNDADMLSFHDVYFYKVK